jgi:multidrug efflux pump subunit AcrA (membrane-fusion protein)
MLTGQEAGAVQPVQAEGRLAPRHSVALAAAAAGRVVGVYVREGQLVQAGDRLVRLDGIHLLKAEVAAAQLEHTLALVALEAAQDQAQAAVELARFRLALAQANRELAFAEDHYTSLTRPEDPRLLAQADANRRLTQKLRDEARKDLDKARRQYDKKNDMLWRFVSRRQFRLQLAQLEARLADFERRRIDAEKKYNDLVAPPDPVEVALAAARLKSAQEQVAHAGQEIRERQDGPDPDVLQQVKARISAASARLAAAETAVEQSEILAPISGKVVALAAQPGEWLAAGQIAVQIAGLDAWQVETRDLEEDQVVSLFTGQEVLVSLPAFPNVELKGTVESVGWVAREEDGDVFYPVTIALEPVDIPLRWGMKARLEFLPPENETSLPGG